MVRNSLPVFDGDSNFGQSQAVAHGAKAQRILLVCPPYQTLGLPSLAIAQLATLLCSVGIECHEEYSHFEWARLITKSKYDTICEVSSTLEGELVFAEALHGPSTDPAASECLARQFGESTTRRTLVREFGQQFLRRVLDLAPDLVGFTTSFGQLMASLWLTQIVKSQLPQARVVLGGSACTEPMGQRILDAYPYVDYVVSGFGEQPLLDLARGHLPAQRLIRNREPPSLDELPVPNYDAFARNAALFPEKISYSLAFEASRGCWWGQKNHCAFCGLNGRELRATAKSSQRVVAEVRTLWQRYRLGLYATDTMLAHDHLRHAVPVLAQDEEGPELFFELKSNMREADLVTLKQARVTTIQPGIESLNSHLLKLMNKGVSAIRNLVLLKWCRERRMRVLWNLLCAIPGESHADYDQQLLLIDKIPHFFPPDAVKIVRMDRFSPYFEQYSAYGWSSIEPFREYRWLHPHVTDEQLRDIAYHFNARGGITPGPYVKRLQAARREWIERFQTGDGLFLDPVRGLIRNVGSQGFDYGTDPTLLKILALTHQVAPVGRVLSLAGCGDSVIERLHKSGIVYVEGDKIINLAVRTQPPSLDSIIAANPS